MFFCVFLREFGSIAVSRSLASRSDPGMTLAPARHCMWWLRHHRLRLRLCLASRTLLSLPPCPDQDRTEAADGKSCPEGKSAKSFGL